MYLYVLSLHEEDDHLYWLLLAWIVKALDINALEKSSLYKPQKIT